MAANCQKKKLRREVKSMCDISRPDRKYVKNAKINNQELVAYLIDTSRLLNRYWQRLVIDTRK